MASSARVKARAFSVEVYMLSQDGDFELDVWERDR